MISLDVFRQTLQNLDLTTHLRHSCRRLRVVHLWKEQPDDGVVQPLGPPEYPLHIDTDHPYSDLDSDDSLIGF